MGKSQKALVVAALSLLSVSPAWAAADTTPLKPGEAAVVGGWFSPSNEVQGMALQPLTDVGGCLRLMESSLVLTDHQTTDTAVIAVAHRLRPGRYALVGVQWLGHYRYQYDWGGVSRQDGDPWVVTIEPGVVTDLGVWPITSPYAHRYVLGAVDLNAGLAAAHKAAGSVGPLVIANWARAPVAKVNGACPPISQAS
jgi:hypothetical protein